MLAALPVLCALVPTPVADSSRRAFLGRAAALGCAALPPFTANAALDCLQNCRQNCGRLAGGSKEYCEDSCSEYCAQDDRKDGLSGSVGSEGAEFGFASSFKNPFAEQKPTVYGDDKVCDGLEPGFRVFCRYTAEYGRCRPYTQPPGLPDLFGLNKALAKAVAGGDLTGGVQGQGTSDALSHCALFYTVHRAVTAAPLDRSTDMRQAVRATFRISLEAASSIRLGSVPSEYTWPPDTDSRRAAPPVKLNLHHQVGRFFMDRRVGPGRVLLCFRAKRLVVAAQQPSS
jgi:hypothetical protein